MQKNRSKERIDYIMSWKNEALKKLDEKLSITAVKSFNKLPYTTKDGVHDGAHPDDVWSWTAGFWPALMVLMHKATGKSEYLETARNGCKLLDRAFTKCELLHHDVGFMWNISSGADYRLTGDEKQKNRMLLAANTLMGRFNTDAEYIRAWNGAEHKGYAIIDCMMNIPMLFRASNITDDDRFAMVARRHADKTMKYHVRADGSVNHINEYNPATGEFISAHAGQGCTDESSWTRGQSWGIYGFALTYRFTKKQEYLDTSRRIANYFIENVKKNGYIPPCDFKQPDDSNLIDTTAGAITACGLLELASFLPQSEAKKYLDCADKMLKALYIEHCNFEENEDSILQDGTEAFTRGFHMPIIYGDYFFTEGICRLCGIDVSFMW